MKEGEQSSDQKHDQKVRIDKRQIPWSGEELGAG